MQSDSSDSDSVTEKKGFSPQISPVIPVCVCRSLMQWDDRCLSLLVSTTWMT